MFQFQLKNTAMLSPKVKNFVMSLENGGAFNYLPGQFITVHFDHQGKTIRRSYSIANAPQQDNQIEFAAGYVASGPGTEYLFQLKEGDSLQVSGPFGRLVLKEHTPQRYIMVATSTGVTPFRSMIPALEQRLDAHPELSIVIFEGVQTSAEILYAEDFLNWAARCPRVTFRAFLSREQNTHQPHLRHGYVQHGFQELALDPTKDDIYLCGNPAMIDDSFNILKEHGFTTQQIVREKYISSTK